MLTVICDNDEAWLDQASEIILTFGRKNNIDMELAGARGSKNLTVKLYNYGDGKRVKIVKGHKYTLMSPSVTSSKAK
ncbi:MAG: hypothetical protein LIP12_09845 [Clostridiales bacterium]|nr:hypothetical protein [Clostridiales bacterium]